MSVAQFFYDKCTKLLEENVNLTINKLSDPASFLNVEVSGALAEAAKGSVGDMAKFGEDYLKSNADKAALGAVKALGAQDKVRGGIGMAFNMISSSIAFKNDLVFMFMKQVARNAIVEIEKKREILTQLNETLLRLLNAMRALNEGDPIFEQYLEELREALFQISQAEEKTKTVARTLQASDFWLSRVFTEAKDHLLEADKLIKPLEDNPYLQMNSKSLAKNLGVGHLITNDEQQKQNVLLIPRLTEDLIQQAQGYSEAVTNLNALLEAFVLGLDQINSTLPDMMKKYVGDFLETAISDMGNLREEMGETLNGAPGATRAPVPNFNPAPLEVSTKAYKWALDLNLIIEFMRSVPAGTLGDLNPTNAIVDKFESIIDKLKGIDTYSRGTAVVIGTDGQEELTTLESQLLTLMVEANTALVSSSVREEAISLGQSIVTRNNIVLDRDKDIEALLQEWVDTPIPAEEDLQRILDSIFGALRGLGLNRAADKLANGNFQEFFNLNPKTATYAGAALTTLALLKDCFDTTEEEQEITEVQNEVEQEEELLKVDVSFNFDLAIFNNLEECARFESLAKVYSLKEQICGLLESTGAGSAFNAAKDLVSF